MTSFLNALTCDWCLRSAANGDYARLGGQGRIREAGQWHICDECRERRCPYCGQDGIVLLVTPTGGDSYRDGRCEACGREWHYYREMREE